MIEPTPNQMKELLNYFCEKFGLDQADGTYIENTTCMNKLWHRCKREDPDEKISWLKKLIDMARKDDFFGDKITRVAMIQTNLNAILRPYRKKETVDTRYPTVKFDKPAQENVIASLNEMRKTLVSKGILREV